MNETVECPSVCLSHHSTAAAAGLLLSAVRAGDVDRRRRAPSSSGAAERGRSTALSGKHRECRVDSRVYDAEHRLVLIRLQSCAVVSACR